MWDFKVMVYCLGLDLVISGLASFLFFFLHFLLAPAVHHRVLVKIEGLRLDYRSLVEVKVILLLLRVNFLVVGEPSKIFLFRNSLTGLEHVIVVQRVIVVIVLHLQLVLLVVLHVMPGSFHLFLHLALTRCL